MRLTVRRITAIKPKIGSPTFRKNFPIKHHLSRLLTNSPRLHNLRSPGLMIEHSSNALFF